MTTETSNPEEEFHRSHDLFDISDASLVADLYCTRCHIADDTEADMEKLREPCPALGYHKAEIKKGVLGEASKIQEELDELTDALDQSVAIMALVEASDLYGSLEAFLEKNYPMMTMDDLKKMSDVTKRAFRNGRR